MVGGPKKKPRSMVTITSTYSWKRALTVLRAGVPSKANMVNRCAASTSTHWKMKLPMTNSSTGGAKVLGMGLQQPGEPRR